VTSRLRRWWQTVVLSASTRRGIAARRWAADGIAIGWSVQLALQLAALWIPAAATARDRVLGWFAGRSEWEAAIILAVVKSCAFAYVWFWAWMGLDAYSRRFGDSDALSARRLLWLLALCAGWLTAPVYWFVVKRKDMNARVNALRAMPGAAQ
jgi:hypothetical protein